MTTEQKYEAVAQAIRQALPRLEGKEPMLNDVLEWLGSDFSIDVYSNYFTSGRRELMCSLADRKREKYNEMTWDISKPYLKDQSEELINFLYELTI